MKVLCGPFESLRQRDVKATKRYSLRDQRENSQIEKCVNEKRKKERETEEELEERSDGELPLAALDNEMDALGCVVAKRQHD